MAELPAKLHFFAQVLAIRRMAERLIAVAGLQHALGDPFFQLVAADFEMHAVFTAPGRAPCPSFGPEKVGQDGQAQLKHWPTPLVAVSHGTSLNWSLKSQASLLSCSRRSFG